MGADGHVGIYDLKKIKEKVTEKELEYIRCSMVYEHELEGRQYLTVYHGDNIYSDAQDYDDMIYGKSEMTREQWDDIWKRIRECKITSWEVWT